MTLDALRVDGLRVTFPDGTCALRGIELSIPAGGALAVVGESGCGKTTLGRAILRLLPRHSAISGSVWLGDVDLATLSEAGMRGVRGRTVGLVAQNPYAACNPLLTVGRTMKEAWLAHRVPVAMATLVSRLVRLRVPDADERVRHRPHRWSGGMLQRAGIVSATVEVPLLLIADEPTSALDADLADETLQEIRRAAPTLLLITHDLDLAGRHADSVAVLYAGKVVEVGPAGAVLAHPRHPYTAALLDAVPRQSGRLPAALPGSPPRLCADPPGCAFADRCTRARTRCRDTTPELDSADHATACHYPLPEGEP